MSYKNLDWENIESMETDGQCKNWCFTINNYTLTIEQQLQNNTNIQYLIYGHEEAPTTGTPHLQGYVQFMKKLRRNGVSKERGFKHAFVVGARGTPMTQNDYCGKDHDNIIIIGTPIQSRQRTDLIDFKKSIVDECQTVGDLLEQGAITSYQKLKFAEALQKYRKPSINRKVKIIYIWGSSGVGKSWTARHYETDKIKHFWQSSTNLDCWEGYTGQRTILIDELRESTCSYKDMLMYTDEEAIKVNVKYGSEWLRATTIFITSPYPPDKVWDTEEDTTQFLRRITHVIHFNGSLDKETKEPDAVALAERERVQRLVYRLLGLPQNDIMNDEPLTPHNTPVIAPCRPTKTIKTKKDDCEVPDNKVRTAHDDFTGKLIL